MSKANLRNFWAKFQKLTSPLPTKKHHRKLNEGFPGETLLPRHWSLEIKLIPSHPGRAPQLFSELLFHKLLFSSLYPPAFSSYQDSLSSPNWHEEAGASMPSSLILWLLLTRREKRSCLEKVLPGAAEATAIRRGPNSQGW